MVNVVLLQGFLESPGFSTTNLFSARRRGPFWPRRYLILVLFLVTAIELPLAGEIFETQVEQATGYDGAYGQFRLWLPEGSHPKRVIALIWGGNQCSLNAANDPGWRSLARSAGCALLTCYFAPQTADNPWDAASSGSGSELLNALKELSARTGESQLANAGVYLVGDSQGGQFAFHFAAWCPDRTLGFVSIKGGRHQPESIPGAVKVPGLFFLGQLDLPFRISNVVETFTQGRCLGAPWCLAIDPGAKHAPGSCTLLVKAFIEALSKAPQGNSSSSIFFPESDEAAVQFHLLYPKSWFPSAAFRQAWKRFQNGDHLTDTEGVSFDSAPPPVIADAVPLSVDLGAINSGDKSNLFCVKVKPRVSGFNGHVKLLSRSYLSNVKIDERLPAATLVSAQLDTTGLPLGRFDGILPLRFDVGDEEILGAINVPVTAIVVGDVRAIPSLIDIGSIKPQSRILVKIEIRSKSNVPTKYVSCQVPDGVEFVSASSAANPLELTFALNFTRGAAAKSASGFILLHLSAAKEWTLRVPFVASFM